MSQHAPSTTQKVLIKALERAGTATQAQLCQAVNRRPATVSAAMTQLEQAGLVNATWQGRPREKHYRLPQAKNARRIARGPWINPQWMEAA